MRQPRYAAEALKRLERKKRAVTLRAVIGYPMHAPIPHGSRLSRACARDRAAILTTVLTGLRRSELLGLTAGAIEAKAGRVYYRTRTKGGHARYRELPAPAWQAIRRALVQLGTPYETLDPEAPLFPISGRGFAANLRRYAKRAGLEGVTPHVLRHTAAKMRRETGASIEDVGRYLGHRSLHTTSIYLRQLEGETDPGWQGVAAALGIEGEQA